MELEICQALSLSSLKSLLIGNIKKNKIKSSRTTKEIEILWNHSFVAKFVAPNSCYKKKHRCLSTGVRRVSERTQSEIILVRVEVGKKRTLHKYKKNGAVTDTVSGLKATAREQPY